MRQLLVASEYSEPANYFQIVVDRLRQEYSKSGGNIALLLITKKLRDCYPILKAARDFEIPTITHVTITGLGDSYLEPHIPGFTQTLEDTSELFRTGILRPETTVLRIDPIIPILYNGLVYMTLFEEFSELGVKDCRVSIIDYYPHVRNRFDKKALPHPGRFSEDQVAIDTIVYNISRLGATFGFTTHLCAETTTIPIPNVDILGCASKEEWAKLGIMDLRPIQRKQRGTCTCNLQKKDLLSGLSKGCTPGCLYCYWRRNSDTSIV